MRITSTGAAARPEYYDRNPTQVDLGSTTGSVAPHILTFRYNYTVPTGRKFLLGMWRVYWQRITAAAPVGRTDSDVQITPNGGSAIVNVDVIGLTNGVGDHDGATGGQATVLLAGDNIAGGDIDGSTGGGVVFTEAIQGTEFDA